MDRQQALKKLNEIVMDQLDLDSLDLQPATLASDVEGWDSLAHIRIMIAVEQAFGLRLQTHQINAIENVGELLDLLVTA